MTKPYSDKSSYHDKAPHYPVDVYINYARSMFLEVERNVIENPPRRPAEFWRLVEDIQQRSAMRLRRVQATIQD